MSWADPQESNERHDGDSCGRPSFGPNAFEQFVQTKNLGMLIRSHGHSSDLFVWKTIEEKGYSIISENTLITVHSATQHHGSAPSPELILA